MKAEAGKEYRVLRTIDAPADKDDKRYCISSCDAGNIDNSGTGNSATS
ncbi:hypothetical protein S7711_11580 [Stachybotrys chartarum IBT 7711]|uniref:Uncharacterized protein n=1 Tax=Stachybotrys chartarum (strain CBS 109288 / IBT 7711) TaxID=1280523 RepID=A0A084BA28_STACB|nr:hypothetical protein S7711_11580 [Stachybotrys chartarum IBT 7711]